MKVFNPFGPKIAITKIPKKIINKINKEVDLIVNNKSRSKKSDYSKELVGQVKQEIKLSNKFVNKHILKFIKSNVKKYIKQCTNKNVKKMNLKSFWVVRQYKNEYNPVHFHNGNISGVGQLLRYCHYENEQGYIHSYIALLPKNFLNSFFLHSCWYIA